MINDGMVKIIKFLSPKKKIFFTCQNIFYIKDIIIDFGPIHKEDPFYSRTLK